MESGKYKILVVDDAPLVLKTIKNILEDQGYEVTAVEDGVAALGKIKKERYHLVITDNQMPNITGLELTASIHALYRNLPVILITGHTDVKTAIDAIKQGVFDFVTKPFQATYLLNTVKKAVEYSRLLEVEKNYRIMLENSVQAKTADLLTMALEIITLMATAAEFRDTESGPHISRVGHYAAVIAKAMDLPDNYAESLRHASALHDIGKIGIPDAILMKPGPLTSEEYEIMKEHTVIGHRMLLKSSEPIMRLAASIALNHHERWDGSGYPRGLKEQDIPLEARIVLMADLYDSLRSSRPYKLGLTHEEALRVIIDGDKRTRPEHFDPKVYQAFIKMASTFEKIFSGAVVQADVPIPLGLKREPVVLPCAGASFDEGINLALPGKILSLN
jgi:putative two-component system response regulator